MSAKNKEKKEKPNALVRTDPDYPAFGTTPFTMMRRFMDDMDRLFVDFNNFRPAMFETKFPFPAWSEFEGEMWSPNVEVRKNNGEMTVRAELPGIKLDDITVEIADGALTLSGKRKEETEEKKQDFYRSEFSYGSFYRRIPLPEGTKPENATAKFENGVLDITVALPTGETRSGRIEIQTGTEPKKAASATN
jgi:HSP20 family protein